MNSALYRNGAFGVWKHLKRQELFHQAAKAQALQRELVQKTLHQLAEYNEETHGAFVRPMLVSKTFQDNWNNWTEGASEEEVADLQQAQATIAHYDKIYSIFEYSSDLNHVMNVLKTRIDGHNPTIPMNVYRISPSVAMENMFPEIESCLQAYYDLIDECAATPEWQKKVRFDLGNTASYLALTIDESSRDAAVAISPVFARFDMEKQLYFK